MNSWRSAARKAFVVIWFAGAAVTSVAAQVPSDDPDLEIREFDIIELQNGNRLEGEVVRDGINELLFRYTNGNEVRFPRGDIKSWLPKNPPQAVYEVRKKKYFAPGRAEDQTELARWCLSVGLTAEGISHYEEATTLEPKNASTYETLLGLYRVRGGEERTTEEHDRELSTVLRGIESEVEVGSAKLSLHAARMLVDLGDPRGAILLLEPLAERDAGDPVVEAGQDLLVELLDRVGQRSEARELFGQFVADETRASVIPLRRLSALWLLEDAAAEVEGAEEALEETLDEILRESPADGKAHLWRGSLAMLQGDPARARTSFEKAFQLGEVGAVAAVTIALNFARSGEPDKALELLSMARSAPAVADLVLQVEAYTQENLGDDELAAALWRDAVDLEIAAWQTWVLSIQGRDRLDEDFPFDREASRALDSVGSNPAAFAEIAVLIGDRALAEGRGEDARRWLGYARSAGRGLPEVLLRVGLAHLSEGGDLTIARGALEEAVEIAPEDPDVLNALGCLEYRVGKLEEARRRFERVTALVPAMQSGDASVPEARGYALSALEQIDRALGEDVWSDDFQRADGPQVLNNWEKHETFGINIAIQGGTVRFAGTQKFQPDGLTKLVRPVEGSSLARLRALLEISPSTPGRIGIRMAQAEGSEEGDGVVIYRDLDGTIAVALNSDDEAVVIRSDGDGEELDTDHTIIPTQWPSDGEPHWIELRLPRDEAGEVGASIYLDGVLVMNGVPVPRMRKRGTTIVGVSGQADLDRNYGFGLHEIEIFRRRPRLERGGQGR